MTTFARTDENGFTVYTCPGCGGSAHPATGCAYSPTFVWCWQCTLEWCRWVTKHTNGKGLRRGVSFYDHVVKCRPEGECS